ncbi:MAG: GldL-related protein [Bacteroidia bacterium]
MYSLNDKQIDFILNDISARGVKTEDLQYNLLDHICCIIENELEENGDFEQFYRRTISAFYKKELKELEDETQLLLTFKNYYTMKKTMFISGAIATIGFILGSFFKIMHWPGASPMFLLGMVSASFVFLPLMFTLKLRETKSTQDKFIIASGTVVAILFCLASLFRVMHWPGGGTMWLSTLGLFFFVFLPLYFFNGIRNPETKVNTITSSVMMILIAGSLFLLTSLRGRYITEYDVYSYLNSQDLVKFSQKDFYKNSKFLSNQTLISINTKCEQLKAILIDEEIGTAALNENMDEGNLRFRERSVKNTFFNNNVALGLLNGLRKEVTEYNSMRGTSIKIPTEHSVLDMQEVEYNNVTNLWMLNNLTLIQLECVNAGRQLVAEK